MSERLGSVQVTGLPRPTSWVRDAVAAGAATAAVAAGAVVLMHALPFLAFAYPFVLIPVVFAGPLAIRHGRASLARLLATGALAGFVSGALTALALAAAVSWLGERRFALTGAATAPPMPPLPRPDLFGFLSWPQEDVLLLSALLGALLAVAYGLAAQSEDGPLARLQLALMRAAAPLRLKLAAAFFSLGALTLATAWLGFSALEDMHLRGHTLQNQTHWADHVDALATLRDRTQALAGSGASAEARRDELEQIAAQRTEILTHLREATSHEGISGSQDVVVAIAAAMRPQVDALARAMERHASSVERPLAGESAADQLAADREIERALRDVTTALHEQMSSGLAAADLAHHGNLIAMLLFVLLAGMLTFVVSRAMANAIIDPLSMVGAHLARLARGDFSGRLAATNGDEIGRLAIQLNGVMAELDRLYRTERDGRAMAEALASREHELAATKEFWAHTIVHDLRGPLSVVSGFAELLRHERLGKLSGEQAAAVAQMERASSKMLLEVQDILDIFRLEQSAFELDLQRVSTSDLLRDAVEATRQPGRRPVAEVTSDPAGMLDVWGDRRLLLRALENLLQNAYKHAGEQAAVAVTALAGPDDLVTLTVDDDGPGIAPEQRARVFQQFAQGKHERPGAGLGLTFCQNVAQRHGGRIWIATSPLGGARMCLAIPSLLAMEESVPPGQSPPARQPGEAGREGRQSASEAAVYALR